jgi:hypothetical protein
MSYRDDWSLLAVVRATPDICYSKTKRRCLTPKMTHTDPLSAVSALAEFQSVEGIDEAVKERILTHNSNPPQRVLGYHCTHPQ